MTRGSCRSVARTHTELWFQRASLIVLPLALALLPLGACGGEGDPGGADGADGAVDAEGGGPGAPVSSPEQDALLAGLVRTTLESPAGTGSGEPFLTSTEDGLLMSWLQATGDGAHELRMARLEADGFGVPRTVARGERFFVNWADFPSIHQSESGRLWAHWLQRGPAGGYDYGVRIAYSDDDGESWSDPWTPHDDSSPTEHGFVSAFPVDDGMGFVWLDGRGYADGDAYPPPTHEMGLRYRVMGADGVPGPEQVVDGRVCDCCQTDAAMSGAGPVVVYRDRSPEEVRDIYLARFVDGAWQPGVRVHPDNWVIDACPVNGPAVAAQGDVVIVAWFTAADDVPRVRLARSEDGGATFGPAVQVDGGDPSGRVDLVMAPDGAAVVSWLERTGGDRAAVQIRRVAPDGAMSSAMNLAASTEGRGAGFPRIAWTPDGRLVAAWTATDSDRVELTMLAGW